MNIKSKGGEGGLEHEGEEANMSSVNANTSWRFSMTKVLNEYGDKFSLLRKQFSLTPKTQRNAHILKSGVTMCLFLRSGAIDERT